MPGAGHARPDLDPEEPLDTDYPPCEAVPQMT